MSGEDELPRVLLTLTLPLDLMEELKKSFRVTLPLTKYPMPRSEFLSLVPGMEGILCTSDDKIDEELLTHAGDKLKVVSTMSAGYNHIDLEAAKSHKLVLGHTPGVLTDSVAELNVVLALSLLRGVLRASHSVTSGDWAAGEERVIARSLFAGLGESLVGKTVGFLGLGRIGLATAKRLQPFGVGKILYCNRNTSSLAQEVSAEKVSLLELAEQSDLVFVCASLSQSTHHIINREFLNRMKTSSYLINTSRGALVDQEELVQALQEEKISGAGLDVMTPEPLPPSSSLARCPNVVLLPHMGSATSKTRLDMARLAVDNLTRALHGESMPASIPL